MRYFCHANPDILTLATEAIATRPGVVARAVTPFHPGGGGQLPDRACGGTHLSSARGRPLHILKIENKRRHNRRIRVGLAGPWAP